MSDNVQTSSSSQATPSSSTGVQSSPSSNSSTPSVPAGGYTDSHSMFADMEKLLGLDSEDIPNLTEAQSSRAATEDDFLSLGDEEGAEDASTADDTSTKSSEEDRSIEEAKPDIEEGNKTSFPTHKFNKEIGGKQYDFDIKSPEQLNSIVSKAIVADQVYSKYQSLKEEAEILRSDRAVLDNIDRMLESDPHSLLDNLTEGLDDDVVRQWIIQKAEELNQDPQQRAIQRKLKEHEVLKAKMDSLIAEKEAIEQSRRNAALESDKHTVGAWLDGKRSLLAAKVPEKYMSLVEDQMKYVMLEARDRTRRKETVTIKTLDSMLTQKIKPILELIERDKPTRDVNREVGKATQSKKEQSLSRIQSSTSQRQPQSNQTNMKKIVANKDNPIGIFDEILKGMDSGRLHLRKG